MGQIKPLETTRFRGALITDKEINKQFGIVNGKLDKVLDHLEAINAQLFGIVGRLQIIDGRLDEINQNLASLDKKLELMDRRLVTIQQTLDRLEAGPRKRCLGWIKHVPHPSLTRM